MEYHLTIKQLPEDVRPRERLLREGSEVLSNIELLAILLRTGSRNETALELAARLLTNFGGVKNLINASVEELSETRGIGLAKAAQIKAALELGKRIASTNSGSKFLVRSPEDVSNLLMEEMRHYDREYFKVIALNTKNRIISVETISVGSLNSSIVHPRELFKTAIKKSTAALILVHNHPSGDPTPSREDIEVTKRLWEAGKLLGIEVLDHIIIGDKQYTSFKEQGLI